MTALTDHMKSIMTTPEQDPRAVGGGRNLPADDPYGVPPEITINVAPPEAPKPPPEPEPPQPITDPVNANSTPVGAPLEHWLRQELSGWTTLPQEYYDHFGGDQILKNVQQFDPAARWVPIDIGGGEGGSMGMGYRLDFDRTKLPQAGGGHPMFASGFRPANFGEVYNGQLVYNDPYYGQITPTWNVKKSKDPMWTKLAPLFVGGVAGLAGGAAAAGAAGGLSAAEAGPGAAAAIGSQAAGSASPWVGSAPWWALTGSKQIPSVGNAAAPYLNTPYQPMFPDPNFDPNAFNAAGSAKKATGTNDSSLVATQFADDPYRFSG